MSRKNYSTMTANDLERMFGLPNKPKIHSGPASNGDRVHSVKTWFDRSASKNGLIFIQNGGSQVSCSPAEYELLSQGTSIS